MPGIVIALDTLAYARRPRQAGFSEEQADAQAEALAAVMVESLATKSDLQEMALRLETRFARIDERFSRIDERFIRVDERFEHLERRMDMRFAEQGARFRLFSPGRCFGRRFRRCVRRSSPGDRRD